MSKVSTLLRTPVVSFFKRHTSQGPSKRDVWRLKLKGLAFNWSGYNKYGLYTDDLGDTDNLVIAEALRRLPKEVLDARNFRLIRAAQLDFLRTYLPREKWTTYEQDLAYRYMKPYVDEVMAERQEIYNFGCSNYRRSDWPAGEVK